MSTSTREGERKMARNIMHFTTDDVVALIGREPTDAEYRHIVNSLACNVTLTELLTDTVCEFTVDQGREGDETTDGSE